MAAKKKKRNQAKRSSSTAEKKEGFILSNKPSSHLSSKNSSKNSSKKSSSTTPSSSKGKAYRLGLLGLLLFTFLVYSPTFQNTFTNWDDDLYVEKNDLVTQFNTKGMFYALDLGGTLRGAFDEKARQELIKRPL